MQKLPSIPRVEQLILSDNSVDSLDGLERFHQSALVELHLDNNPIAFTLNYRQRYEELSKWMLLGDSLYIVCTSIEI